MPHRASSPARTQGESRLKGGKGSRILVCYAVMGSEPASASFIHRLTTYQIRKPALPLVIIAVISALTGFAATQLRVLTGFESLLPESKASVLELKRVAKLTGGV